MHVFFRGPVGIGKSTALQRTIELLQTHSFILPAGFSTNAGQGADRGVYLSPFGGPYQLEDANRIGMRSDCGAVGFPAVFDTLGVSLLDMTRRDANLLCMDELGFMENEAFAFQRAVLDCLNGAIPVLGVIKERRVPWHEQIVTHPSVTVLEIDLNTRSFAPEKAARLLQEAYK